MSPFTLPIGKSLANPLQYPKGCETGSQQQYGVRLIDLQRFQGVAVFIQEFSPVQQAPVAVDVPPGERGQEVLAGDLLVLSVSRLRTRSCRELCTSRRHAARTALPALIFVMVLHARRITQKNNEDLTDCLAVSM